MKIISDPAAIEPYLTDESNAFKATPAKVSQVLLPESVNDLATALSCANSKKILCTVSGAGTGITGSRVPMQGGYIISMERFLTASIPQGWKAITCDFPSGKATIAISPDDRRAKAPPGLTLDMLTEMLPDNLFYPPDPTESTAQLGGTVATNASGSRTFYYGPTRDWVSGLMVVLADGDTLTIKRGEVFADDGVLRFATDSGQRYEVHIPTYRMPRTKNAAGLYASPDMDLIDLFVGCEGILGVFAAIEIKLAPRPTELIADLAFFGSEPNALAYADDIRALRESGVIAIEYFDASSLAFMRGKEPRIKQNYHAAVLVEALGDRDDTVDAILESCERYKAVDDWSGPPEEFHEFRHSLPESVNSYLKQRESYKLALDLAVPAGGFGEMMQAYRRADETFRKQFPREGVHTVLFGHLGNYHLHFNFIAHNHGEMAFAKKLYVKLAKRAVALGGTISAEHGVGKKTVEVAGRKVPYLELMYGREGLEQIASIKRALDPNLILNIGNMLPKSFF